jgi:hypothetical protein
MFESAPVFLVQMVVLLLSDEGVLDGIQNQAPRVKSGIVYTWPSDPKGIQLKSLMIGTPTTVLEMSTNDRVGLDLGRKTHQTLFGAEMQLPAAPNFGHCCHF